MTQCRVDEAERVKREGGEIFGGRVMNRLAITRAFGDFEFKLEENKEGNVVFKNFLSCEPEVRQIDIDPFIDDFIVVASDGLYDKLTSQDVVNFIRTKLGTMPFQE